ncbi:CHASE3 domain-containing protein [uncultured Polaribacter sp.]|uniref:CHASE3 domain-containing protein n=1 Tax=uncultured Polaribacter sp. TaxID=174711 RepID=UPI002619FEEA|nr:CHASE3 domain-containing protein [uncultured Polaribacter sp.]
MKKNYFFKSTLFLKVVLLSSLFVILVMGGITYMHISNLTNSTKIVVKTYKVNVELERIISYLREAESDYRKYIVEKDVSYLNPYLDAKEKVNNSFLKLNELINENSKQHENLTVLNKLTDSLFFNFSKTNIFVENNETNTKALNLLYFKENAIIDSIRRKTNEMFFLENKLFNNRQEKYESDLQFTPLFFYLVLLITLIIIILAYSKITNDLKNIKVKNDQLLIFKESTNQSEIIGKHGNWVWHIESDIFTYSDNLYRLLGEEPQSFEATLVNFLKFVHPEDVDKLTEDLNKMTHVEELPFINYRIIQKNGSIKYLKAYAKSFYSLNGQKRLLGNTSDITEEIESIIALEERNLELERNNKELSAFNYAASHDLQEPLRKIQTFVSRLEEKEAATFSDAGHQYLERIKFAAGKMRILIDDLLQFSRTNKPDKEFVEADLNALFENAMQDATVIILEKKAKITSDTLPKAKVVAFQIQQLFLNLLVNSLKYSKEETFPIIKVNYSNVKAKETPHLLKAAEGNYHKITFTDNGIGFDQKYAEKIFDLFNRLHNKQDYSGSGIGLSICKKIVENHNGFIFSKGEINVGAVFTVYLPVI